jgi:hypothetical protein
MKKTRGCIQIRDILKKRQFEMHPSKTYSTLPLIFTSISGISADREIVSAFSMENPSLKTILSMQ